MHVTIVHLDFAVVDAWLVLIANVLLVAQHATGFIRNLRDKHQTGSK